MAEFMRDPNDSRRQHDVARDVIPSSHVAGSVPPQPQCGRYNPSMTAKLPPRLSHFPPAWQPALSTIDRSAVKKLAANLDRKMSEETVYPPPDHWFRALELTSPEATKVVLLGQDPYHGEGQADGLAFSVPRGVDLRPSLRNIYKELESDMKIARPTSGDLTQWAKQGVLLLNTALTVRAGKAGAHKHIGWYAITDAVLRWLARERNDVVFLLMGSAAQKRARLCGLEVNKLVATRHPVARGGFFGSEPFSKIEELLRKRGATEEIDWVLAER